MTMISLQGTLTVYNPQTRLTYFESGPENSTSSVVFIAGLLDGYNALPYLPMLSQVLANLGFSLIQVMLSSSHLGYGISSLQDDVKELDVLFKFLREERGKSRLFLVGHSTGCQDAISYATYGLHRSVILGMILQGPVSDREFMQDSMEMYGKYLRLAQRMINDGKGQELMVREVDVAPVTAYRFNSLASAGGDDDMFSSDIPFEKMQIIFGQVKIPLIMVHSGKDEYIPAHVDKQRLVAQLSAACGQASMGAVVLPDANHAISDQASQIKFCEVVIQFIQQILEQTERHELSQQQSFHGLSI
ncbi:hypothetical protein BCR41DRAFT_425986 [Lobosporangium transversale]|uniref:DUF1749-domain-containing protein n=1 Tax=Lobosporangium transversale TaxID=64571 RepID=A0A1Y2GB70_9FUNG|nr:hypothetical protein BCR41DRAFT_425986 [Lobosporangium transversale]ORZ04318.1 hypothetical protein BCR41DRAFT_425986 [Lobosporangium transversale]|eukprot:XP_021876476.1 hypothetical protein BCR41DRAFT_425986 [Lobosporangium transversale]